MKREVSRFFIIISSLPAQNSRKKLSSLYSKMVRGRGVISHSSKRRCGINTLCLLNIPFIQSGSDSFYHLETWAAWIRMTQPKHRHAHLIKQCHSTHYAQLNANSRARGNVSSPWRGTTSFSQRSTHTLSLTHHFIKPLYSFALFQLKTLRSIGPLRYSFRMVPVITKTTTYIIRHYTGAAAVLKHYQSDPALLYIQLLNYRCL